jgi:hypothetical protein
MNERYQKNTLPAGKTRKSAAASKPSRKGTGPAQASSGSSKSGAKGDKRPFDPPTPEFAQYRRWWWISLMTGLVLVAISFAIRTYGPKGQWWINPIGAVTLGLAYATIFYALYLDWAKMRPMRKEWAAGGSGTKPAKPAKAEKATTIETDSDSAAGDSGDKS